MRGDSAHAGTGRDDPRSSNGEPDRFADVLEQMGGLMSSLGRLARQTRPPQGNPHDESGDNG